MCLTYSFVNVSCMYWWMQNAITISTVIWSIVRYGIDILYLAYFHIFILYPLIDINLSCFLFPGYSWKWNLLLFIPEEGFNRSQSSPWVRFFNSVFRISLVSLHFSSQVKIISFRIISLIMCCYITLPIYALVSQVCKV